MSELAIRLKGELERAYRALAEQAEMQNEADISQWFKDGIISEDEKNSLRKYNQQLEKKLRNSI